MIKKTEDLFARFQAIYGGRWTACYASREAVDMAIAEWDEVIASMSERQMVQAIAWAKTCCPWPPSMAEFLHAGLGIDEELISEEAMNMLSSWERSRMNYKELEKAVRLRRQRALRNLVCDSLLPLLEKLP